MDSALRPRDIQARIRAGESPEAVAAAAGVPVERIDAFAAPVLAERDHGSGLARTHPVRRQGETTSHRTLRNAVVDALAARGVDGDAVEWDSWKLEDRRWQVKGSWEQDGTLHEALFTYDQMGRFSVAANDEARNTIGDLATDDLALVRATQDDTDEPVPTPGPVHSDQVAAGAPDAAGADDDEDAGDPAEEDESEDAFREGGLQEVDGVYDIVPPSRGDLDALFDMLSSFDEDSVKIYAGLVHPKEESTPADPGPPRPDAEVPPAASDRDVDAEQPTEPDQPVTEPPAEAPGAPGPATASGPTEPEQLSLIEGEDAGPKAPARPKRTRRGRASVPSWDEIVFGSPGPRTEG